MRSTGIGERLLVFALAAVAAMSVSVTAAKEKCVAMEDLPTAVREAAKKATAGGTVKHIDMDQEAGRDVYFVEASLSGKDKDLTIAADGTLLVETDEIPLSAVPQAGRTAAEKYFGGSSGLHATKEVAAGVTRYEVGGKKGGKEIYLTFSAAGALLGEETGDAEDEAAD